MVFSGVGSVIYCFLLWMVGMRGVGVGEGRLLRVFIGIWREIFYYKEFWVVLKFSCCY